MVVLVPRKARQVEHDEEVNFAFVAATVRKHSLELAPIGGLRAFAFFFKALEDLETFAAAVLFADSQLSGQAEVFRLLFGLPAVARSQLVSSEGWY